MPGATGLTYTRQAGDHPVYVETATDGNGSRTASADAGATMAVGAAPDTFTAPDGTLLSAYVGESGIGWGASPNRGVIEAGALRNLTALGWYLQPRLGDLPADQFAEADLVVGTSDQMVSLALRIGDDMTAGYMILVRASGIQVARRASSGQTAIIANILGNRMAGTSIRVRFEAEGSALRLYLDGDLLWSGADATFAAGRAGIVANGTVASRKGSYITSFHAGELE